MYSVDMDTEWQALFALAFLVLVLACCLLWLVHIAAKAALGLDRANLELEIQKQLIEDVKAVQRRYRAEITRLTALIPGGDNGP